MTSDRMLRGWVVLLFATICCAEIQMLGGGEIDDNNKDIWGTFVKLAGGESANIAIITSASADPSGSGTFYIDILKAFGAKSFWVPIDLNHTENAESPQIAATIASATGIFFGGGDQSRLIECFTRNATQVPTLALEAIIAQYHANVVIAGTSAGTAIQAGGGVPMVTSGMSYFALRDGAVPWTQNPIDEDDLTYDPLGGFPLFNLGIVDMHFSERGRQGRAIRLAHDTRHVYAFGVDQDTALIFHKAGNDVTFDVVGSAGAYIFDLSWAVTTSDPHWSIYNISATYLTSGDAYHWNSKKVDPPSWKKPLHGTNPSANTSADIFEISRDFTNVAWSLMESTQSTTYGLTSEVNPQWRVNMKKSDATQAWKGSRGDSTLITFASLRIDMVVVK